MSGVGINISLTYQYMAAIDLSLDIIYINNLSGNSLVTVK